MINDFLKQIIVDYQENKKHSLTKRDLSITFIPQMAIGIVGARRTGKTFRTHQMVNELPNHIEIENICRIQFNDHRLIKIPANELHIIDKTYYSLYPEKKGEEQVYFIFDEIHRIPGWEDYILYLLETQTHRIIITGSTASLQRGDYASQLRGKLFPLELLPFSFKEFLRHYKIDRKSISSKGQSLLENYFQRYITQGGFPGLLDIPQEIHDDLLVSYWDTMLLRDIIEAHPEAKINISVLRYFADSLISRIACPMTTTKISESMKKINFSFSIETLYKYLSYLSDAFMIRTVEFYSESQKIRARNYKKVYCIDWALASAVSRGAGVDKTRALENIVYIELCRRGYKISYYKTREGHEIDFVAQDKSGSIEIYQVSYSLEKEDVQKRESRAIEVSVNFLKAQKATIITVYEEYLLKGEKIDISVVPAWKWLLE
ncbi:MAG: ATP-binding protein [Spirochaetales bacterium]|nr:ATP-binding protein [Spirochaetales bacterium]